MLNIFIAALGGFFGTALRYTVNNIIYKFFNAPLYPYGTFFINVSGCFLIGLLAGLIESRVALTPAWQIFLQIGVLGGYTTFSTFGYETFALMRDGQWLLGASNIVLQVALGLIAVRIGYYFTQA